MHSRRHFVMQAGLTAFSSLGLAARHSVAADPMLKESEESAIALAYVEDASQVDPGKFSKFKPDQNCRSCALFQGGSKDVSGGCVLFPGRQVKATGWCSSWSYDA